MQFGRVPSPAIDRFDSRGATRPARFFVFTLALGCAAAGGQATAQDAAPALGSTGATRWFVSAGGAEDTTAGAVGIALGWAAPRRVGAVAVSGATEFAVGRWQVSQGARDGRAGFVQIGVTPVLRLSFGGAFAEAGIGANLIGPTYRTSNRRFTTAFNFGDHVGVGFRGAAGWEVALQLAHYSNGGIKRPNPGENFVRLRVSSDW